MLMAPLGVDTPREFFLSELPEMIGNIGLPAFDASLVKGLHTLCGAEHVAIYTMNDDNSMTGIATASFDGAEKNYEQMSFYVKEKLWRYDPTYDQARAQLGDSQYVALRTDISRLPDIRLRDTVYGRRGIRGRVFICSRIQEYTVGICMCSSIGEFSDTDNLALIEKYAATLFSVLAKHISCTMKVNASLALTSLNDIEECIADQAPDMPRREAQICSRAIYGVTSLGMALELDISQETVMTYRKRAYARLGIATLRELLLWYLDIWSSWPGRGRASTLTH